MVQILASLRSAMTKFDVIWYTVAKLVKSETSSSYIIAFNQCSATIFVNESLKWDNVSWSPCYASKKVLTISHKLFLYCVIFLRGRSSRFLLKYQGIILDNVLTSSTLITVWLNIPILLRYRMLIYCAMIYVNIFHILTRNYHFTLLWQTLSNDPRNRISLRSLARIALKLHWYIHGQCKLPVQRYSSERINAKRFPNRGGPDFLGEIIVDEGRRRRRHPWIGSRVGQ